MKRPVQSMPAALLLALLLAVCVATAKDKKVDIDKSGGDNVGKGVNLYSLEKEIALGRQLAQEVEREAKIVADPVVSEYVNRLGQNLARNSDALVPVSVKVIDIDEINAFALPGGFLFVNTGLLLRAETEAGLAGPTHQYRFSPVDLPGRLGRVRRSPGSRPCRSHDISEVLARVRAGSRSARTPISLSGWL
jgi:predicted Zn-dependent protease